MITASKSTQPLSSATSTAPAGAPAVTPAPTVTPVPTVTPKPGATVARQGESPALWAAYGLACVFLTLLALHLPASRAALYSPLFALFSGLSLLAVLLPASGPRGQRVGLLPGVGLAAVLLLPAPAAAVPLLVANVLYAASRQTSLARRAVLGRGVWLVLASLAAGGVYGWLSGGAAGFRPAAAILASGLYIVLYTAGRQVGLRRKEGQGRQAYRRARVSWRLEAVALLASVPPALLMTLAEPHLGMAGVAAAAALMALLLLIAHFGFEVALLREQVRAMEKISAVTLSQINPSRLIERFLHLSGGLIPYDRASLWLTDHSQTRLERVARRHPMAAPAAEPSLARDPAEAGQEATDAAVRFGEGLVGRVADRQQPLIVRDGARDPRSLDVETTDRHAIPFSLLLLPLVVSGETVGVVQFEREAPGSYTNRDLSRVRALASQVAATIANIRMHRDVYNQSVTDPLTGLYNRRHMQTVLSDERRRAQRYGHPLSVIMLDVDGFKNYNDTYGHPQGDVLLKMLAGLLRDNVRGVDIVGRYGGEEFLILMPETTKEEAWWTAERLRQSIAAASFPGFPNDPDLVVFKTISLGTATFPADTGDTQTLIGLADQALYRAKRGGRNQTVSAGLPPSLSDSAEK